MHHVYAINLFGIPSIWLFVNNDKSEQSDSKALINQSSLITVAEGEKSACKYFPLASWSGTLKSNISHPVNSQTNFRALKRNNSGDNNLFFFFFFQNVVSVAQN